MEFLQLIFDLLDSISGYKYIRSWLKEKTIFRTKSDLFLNIVSVLISILVIFTIFVVFVNVYRLF